VFNARKSTGGVAPRRQLATKAARKSAPAWIMSGSFRIPSSGDDDEDDEDDDNSEDNDSDDDKTTGTPQVMNVTNQQNFDGSFSFTEVLCKSIRISYDVAKTGKYFFSIDIK
jgi:hypothetical protein